jgi:hypothetical protein
MHIRDMARPEISDELMEQVEELTEESFNVPAHRVSFEDRLRILLERLSTYEEIGSDLTQR